jgi:hypothetical protein
VGTTLNLIHLVTFFALVVLVIDIARGFIQKKREKMNQMCLDLSFINKFLIIWGVFVAIIYTLDHILLQVIHVLNLFSVNAPVLGTIEYITVYSLDTL